MRCPLTALNKIYKRSVRNDSIQWKRDSRHEAQFRAAQSPQDASRDASDTDACQDKAVSDDPLIVELQNVISEVFLSEHNERLVNAAVRNWIEARNVAGETFEMVRRYLVVRVPLAKAWKLALEMHNMLEKAVVQEKELLEK